MRSILSKLLSCLPSFSGAVQTYMVFDKLHQLYPPNPLFQTNTVYFHKIIYASQPPFPGAAQTYLVDYFQIIHLSSSPFQVLLRPVRSILFLFIYTFQLPSPDALRPDRSILYLIILTFQLPFPRAAQTYMVLSLLNYLYFLAHLSRCRSDLYRSTHYQIIRPTYRRYDGTITFIQRG